MTTPPESPEPSDQAPPPRRLGRKLLLAVVAVVFALALAESLLHLLGVAGRADRLVRDPIFGWRNRPGWQGPVFSINSRGFLGADFDVPKPKGTVRVFCLGDSCTAGDLLPDFDETYPRQLERLLRKRHPDRAIEVVNAGVGGYSSFHGRLWLEREILACEPDLVVVYFGWNDHWPARVAGPDKEVSGSWSEHVRSWLSWSRLLSLAIRAYHVAAAKQVVVRSGGEPKLVIPEMAGPRRVSIRDYEANLRAIVAMVREREGHTVFVTAPSSLAVAKGAEANWSDPDAVAKLVALHARYNEVVRRVAAEEGVGLVDAASEFARDPDALKLLVRLPYDYIHLSAEGYRRLAGAVADCPAVRRAVEGQ